MIFYLYAEHDSLEQCGLVPDLAFEITNDITLDELNIPYSEDIKAVNTYHSELGSKTSFKPVYYHDFVVLSTGEDYFNTTLWWSVEKNNQELLIQQAYSKDDVSKHCYGKKRSNVFGDNQVYDGKRTISDLFKFTNDTVNNPYNFLTENCRDFARQTFTLFAKEGMNIWKIKNYCRNAVYFVIFVLFFKDYQKTSILLGVLMAIYVITE